MKPKWWELPDFIVYRLTWMIIFALLSIASLISYKWALGVFEGCKQEYEQENRSR